MSVVRINIKSLTLLLLVVANVNSSDSIPIAEYCIEYKNEKYCTFCGSSCTNAYCVSCISPCANLHLEKVLREQPAIIVCSDTLHDLHYNLAINFLIHDDLKIEQTFLGGKTGKPNDKTVSGIFANDVNVCTKNKISFDFNKYYEKNKIVPVEWKLKSKSSTSCDTTITGSYFIRITGECTKYRE